VIYYRGRYLATLAQLVEQRFCKPSVVSSILTGGSNLSMNNDYTRYLVALIVTIAIFITTFYASSYFTNRKLEAVSSIQNNIAVDILSNETQFLLKEISCSDDNFNPVSNQISELGDKLTYTETQLGSNDETVKYLKKYYSLLQIKDYLVGKKIADKCGKTKKSIFMIYMYSNKKNLCNDCAKQAAVISELRQLYPELSVYTFDYDLSLVPIDTLKKIYKIEATSTFPILVVEDKTYYGLKKLDELKALLPDTLIEATSTKSVDEMKSATKATGAVKLNK
jgi:hypothetical protein